MTMPRVVREFAMRQERERARVTWAEHKEDLRELERIAAVANEAVLDKKMEMDDFRRAHPWLRT